MMQYQFISFFLAVQAIISNILSCPLSGDRLTLVVIKEFTHKRTGQTEVHSGYLWSASGGCYPIVDGIPRMLPESMLAYEYQLEQWWKDFPDHKKRIIGQFGKEIEISSRTNKKIQDTFGFEWSLLKKGDNIKIWNLDPAEFKSQLDKELKLPLGYKCKLALDAGCGHGRSARLISNFAETVFGVEVSQAVEIAYEQNDKSNCHFIQGSVLYLPFAPAMFDLVYSSGVLHHNASTQEALQKVATLVKSKGTISIWLYHPFKNTLHHFMLAYRSFTKKLPVKLVYYLNAFSLTPIQWLVSQVRGKKKKRVEIAIEQLDILTPAFRHEHTLEEVCAWLSEMKFANTMLTDSDDYGFSLKATKE